MVSYLYSFRMMFDGVLFTAACWMYTMKPSTVFKFDHSMARRCTAVRFLNVFWKLGSLRNEDKCSVDDMVASDRSCRKLFRKRKSVRSTSFGTGALSLKRRSTCYNRSSLGGGGILCHVRCTSRRGWSCDTWYICIQQCYSIPYSDCCASYTHHTL